MSSSRAISCHFYITVFASPVCHFTVEYPNTLHKRNSFGLFSINYVARPLGMHYNHYVSLARSMGQHYNLAGLMVLHYDHYVNLFVSLSAHGQLVKCS